MAKLELIVAKFGGSSSRDGATIAHTHNNIVLQDPRRRVIVTSAIQGLTDQLIGIGESFNGGHSYTVRLDTVKERFVEGLRYFGINESKLSGFFSELDNAIRNPRNLSFEAYMANVERQGEVGTALLRGLALEEIGIDNEVVHTEEIGIITGTSYRHAEVLPVSYALIARSFLPKLEQGRKIIVIPGFQGISIYNESTTLGRGGADTSGAVVANGISALLYENYTDIDGFKRAHPKIVRDAQTIPFLSYRIKRQLAYLGAKVLHMDVAIHLMPKNIPTVVKDTFHPELPGTYITSDYVSEKVVQGIAHEETCAIVYIFKMGMSSREKTEIEGLFQREGIYVGPSSTSSDDAKYVIPRANENAVKSGLERIETSIKKMGLDVEIEYGRTFISVAGEKIRETPGVMGILASALGSKGINIWDHVQPHYNILFGVEGKDTNEAIRALYEVSFGKGGINETHSKKNI